MVVAPLTHEAVGVEELISSTATPAARNRVWPDYHQGGNECQKNLHLISLSF
jgi:hypothetical protein